MAKRLIALLCTVCVAIAAVSFSAAANTAEVKEESALAAEEFLSGLGIINEADSIAAKGENENVTRGEFALLAYRSLNKKVSFSGGTGFYDLEGSAELSTAVNTLSNLGAIAGTGDGRFEPEKDIKLYDAVAIMLKVMGYKNMAGDPNEIFALKTCVKYGLLLRTELADATGEKKELLEIFAKLLSADLLEAATVTVDGTKTGVEYAVKGRTMLECYFGIYKTVGILNSNGIASLLANDAEKNRITVDELMIAAQSAVCIPIGSKVDVYYRNKDNPELYAIYENKENKSVFMPVCSDVTFDDYTYKYSESGTEKKISVSPLKATFIYNNSILTSSDRNFLLPTYGAITFVDNNGDGNYEVVDIKAYTSFRIMWKGADGSKSIINGENGETVYIDDDCRIIKNSLGELVSEDEITVGQVASCAVFQKNGKKYAAEVILSDSFVLGEIEKTKSKNGTISKLVISGEEYSVYPNNQRLLRKLYPSEESLKLYLDFLGSIADIEAAAEIGNAAAGYVVEIGEAGKGFNKKTALSIYDELGRLKTYPLANKVVIDGAAEKDVSVAQITSKGIKDEIILFKINKAEEISYIDTAADYAEGIITKESDRLIKGAGDNGESSGRGLYYSKKNKSFGGRVNLSESSIVFSIPKSPQTAEESDFAIVSLNDLCGGDYYPVQGYSTDPDLIYYDIVVIKNSKKVMGEAGIAVVTNIGRAINENGDPTYFVGLYDGSGEHEYAAKNDAVIDNACRDTSSTDDTEFKIEAGDVVRYLLNDKKEIAQMVLSYDKSADAVRTGLNLAGTYSYGTRTFAAIPYSTVGGALKIVDASKTDMSALTANDFELIDFSRIQKVLKVTSNGEYKVEEIMPSVINTYKNNGGRFPKIIVNTINQGNTIIVVYE